MYVYGKGFLTNIYDGEVKKLHKQAFWHLVQLYFSRNIITAKSYMPAEEATVSIIKLGPWITKIR